MKVTDFIYHKNTKLIYRISKFNGDAAIFEIKRLGDDEIIKNLSSTDIQNNYILIDNDNLKKDIINIKTTNLDKNIKRLLKYNNNQIEEVLEFNEDDLIFDEINHALNIMLSNNKVKNEELDNLIKELQDEISLEIKQNVQNEQTPIHSIQSVNKIKQNNQHNHNMLNEGEEPELVFNIIDPDPSLTFDNIVLHDETRESIFQTIYQNEFKDLLNNEWKIGEGIDSSNKATVLNWYGEPGTGKTISIMALANQLNKKILKLDFSELISKWKGETGKNIKKYFKKAAEDDLILFIDEADTLLERRSDVSDSNSGNQNQDKNIFMQELDQFDGIVVLTTNLFNNYDSALFRRIHNIEFPLPNKEMRFELFKNLLPKTIKLENKTIINSLVDMTENFSGGDIKNIITNVLNRVILKFKMTHLNKSHHELRQLLLNNVFTLDVFVKEVSKYKINKKNYKTKGSETNKIKIGIAS